VHLRSPPHTRHGGSDPEGRIGRIEGLQAEHIQAESLLQLPRMLNTWIKGKAFLPSWLSA
jgi:hypothetical protein